MGRDGAKAKEPQKRDTGQGRSGTLREETDVDLRIKRCKSNQEKRECCSFLVRIGALPTTECISFIIAEGIFFIVAECISFVIALCPSFVIADYLAFRDSQLPAAGAQL